MPLDRLERKVAVIVRACARVCVLICDRLRTTAIVCYQWPAPGHRAAPQRDNCLFALEPIKLTCFTYIICMHFVATTATTRGAHWCNRFLVCVCVMCCARDIVQVCANDASTLSKSIRCE